MSFNYQEKLLQQLREDRRMVVAKYGAGKCRITLLYFSEVMSTGEVSVIVCPKRNVRTWMVEIRKWWKDEQYMVHTGLTDLEDNYCKTHKHLLILTPHQADTWERRMYLHNTEFENFKIVCMAWDESTLIKNPSAKVSVAAHEFARWGDLIRIALTGDPTPENDKEIWSQFQFIYGRSNPYGATYYGFLRKWFLKVDFGYVLRMDMRDEFFEVFDRHSVRMDEEDWEEHSQAVGAIESYQIVRFDPGSTQLELMETLKRDWALPTPRNDNHSLEKDEYWHTMSILQKSLQIAQGYYYSNPLMENMKSVVYLDQQIKLSELSSLLSSLEKQGHKRVVVWYAFIGDLPLLSSATEYWKTYQEDSLRDFSTSKSDKMEVCVLSVRHSRGINDLKVASVDIFFSNSPSQELRNQAEKRLPRPGTKHKEVLHIDLVGKGLADEKLAIDLQNKTLTDERLATIVTDMFGSK